MCVYRNRKKGYSLSILLVTLLVVSIAAAAVLPVMTKKKDSETNTSNYIEKCIISENAASFAAGTFCYSALNGVSKGNERDISTVLKYLNGSNSTYADAASKILGNACNSGVTGACDIFIQRCANNSTNCGNNTYNMNYYLSNSNSGSSYIEDKALEYYRQGITSFNTSIINRCLANMATNATACNIYSTSTSKTFNLNSNTGAYFDKTTILGTGINITGSTSYVYAAGGSSSIRSGYIYTKDTSCTAAENDCGITGLMTGVGGIKSFNVSTAIGGSGVAKVLVSFDGRQTWKYCTTCTTGSTAWATSTLANIVTNGNSPADISNALTNYIIPDPNPSTPTVYEDAKFDFAVYLTSVVSGSTNYARLSSVSITYLISN